MLSKNIPNSRAVTMCNADCMMKLGGQSVNLQARSGHWVPGHASAGHLRAAVRTEQRTRCSGTGRGVAKWPLKVSYKMCSRLKILAPYRGNKFEGFQPPHEARQLPTDRSVGQQFQPDSLLSLSACMEIPLDGKHSSHTNAAPCAPDPATRLQGVSHSQDRCWFGNSSTLSF
eukprot:1158357-Pelagomonas_calceolata.AAC.2